MTGQEIQIQRRKITMASKPKYNPDDVERWVTVRGARIPIMKDGTFGVGTMDVRTKDGKVVKTDTTINQVHKMELMAAKNPPVNLDPAAKEMLSNVNYKELKKNVTSKAMYNPDELGLKTTSRNARYDTSRTSEGKVAEAYKNVEIAKQAWRDAEQNKLAISKRLRNEYLKKNYGATYSQMEKKGTYTNKVHQEVGKYVMSVPEFKKAQAIEKDAMSRHVSTTAILKQEYEKYRKLGGIQNADWYKASREWDDED